MTNLRWGFLGNGWIATVLAKDFAHVGLTIQSVGARTQEKAEDFGNQFSIPNRHPSYEALVNDDEVDIVYIATPHTRHHQDALLAIKAGKHVLLEKPFTVNAREAKEVIDAAKSKNVFIMEAMWTRFLPVQSAIQEVIKKGLIGRPRYIVAEHSQELTSKPRLWDPELGGGTLLDLGIYPLNFIVRILGVPSKVTAKAHLTTDKVDESLSAILEYPSDAMATFFSSMSATGPAYASIMGSKGRIDLDYRLLEQTTFRVYNNDAEIIHSYSEEILGTGRQYQALEVERCIKAGQKESPTMTHKDTIDILKLTDEMRSQVGVTYKNDRI
jgi:predicted dehydrogenase